MERWRAITERVMQQQRMVRTFQAAVLEVSVPAAHNDYDEDEESVPHGENKTTIQFSPSGRLQFPNQMDLTKEGQDFRRRARTAQISEERKKREVAAGWQQEDGHPRMTAAISDFRMIPGKGQKSVSLRRMITRPCDSWDSIVKRTIAQYAKKIDAAKDVLSTYHESFLFGEVPAMVKLRTMIRAGPIGICLKILECLGASISVVLYIRFTYSLHAKSWITGVQNGISVFFCIDYLLRIFSAPVRMSYIFSFDGVIDFVSCLPIIFINVHKRRIGGIAQLLLFFRILRVAPLITKVGIVSSTVKQQIFALAIWTVTIIFLAAGIFQFVEYEATGEEERVALDCGRLGCFTFFEAIYFMLVTVATVGYGDITPNTNWGRLVAICCIIISLTYIPAQLNRILVVASLRPYGGRVSPSKVVDTRYIVVWGVLSYSTVQDLLSHFFHPAHDEDLAAYPLHVVIMAPFPPSFELKALIALYGGHVEYIEGKLILPLDLVRVAAHKASAFFLLANKHEQNFDKEDSLQFIRALAVQRHCGPQVRIITELLKPRNEGGAIWDDTPGVEVICTDSLRFKLLARSCFVRGLTTLISNIFKAGLEVSRGTAKEHWMNEYCHGLEMELFPVLVPPMLCGLPFEEVAEFLYRHYRVVLLGLDMEVDGQRQVALHPRGHVVVPADLALLIAPSLHRAHEVSQCGSPEPGVFESLLLSEGTGTWWKFWDACVPGFSRYNHTAEKLATQALLEKIHATWQAEALANEPPRGGEGSEGDVLRRKEELQLSDSVSRAMRKAEIRQPELRRTTAGIPEAIVLTPNSTDRTSPPPRDDKEAKQQTQKAADQFMEAVSAQHEIPSTATNVECLNSVEEAVDRLLTWPPPRPLARRLHPALLDNCQDQILASLADRTMTVVQLTVPHIIVAILEGWPENLFFFVSSMRLPGSPSPPIVILRPEKPNAGQWGAIGYFQDVFFIRGSPIYELDLMRAGIFTAHHVVVVTRDVVEDDPATTQRGTVSTNPASFALDIKHATIAANVERLLTGAGRRRQRLLVEVQHEISYQFLRPKYNLDRSRLARITYERNKDALFHFTPPYMEGKCFSPSTLQFLTYGTFYNKNTVTIVEQLLGGKLEKSASSRSSGASSTSLGRKLEQIVVPKEYVGATWEDTFVGLLHKQQVVAVGLYRSEDTLGSLAPYVYTNPHWASIVNEQDLIYIV